MAEEKKPETDEEKMKDSRKSLSNYAYYSGMGFQMISVIGVFTFIGYEIDKHRNASTPLYTAFFSLAGVFISLYLVIRSVKKN